MSDVQVGLVGAGYWGSKYARVIQETPGVSLKWVADTDVERAVALAAPLGASYNDSVRRFGPADVAIIATPPGTHNALAVTCLELGMDVLVEKPVALSSEDLAEMLEVGVMNGRLLFPGYIYRFHEGALKLAEQVKAGDVGDVRIVRCFRTGPGPIRTDVNALWDLAPHDLSILDMLGLQRPKWGTCNGVYHLDGEKEDSFMVHLEYPRHREALLQVSWSAPEKERSVTVIGSRGTLVWDDVKEKPRVEPLKAMLERFLEARKNHEIAVPDQLQAMANTRILERLEQARSDKEDTWLR